MRSTNKNNVKFIFLKDKSRYRVEWEKSSPTLELHDTL